MMSLRSLIRVGVSVVCWIGIVAVIASAAPTEQVAAFCGDKRKLVSILTATILVAAPALFSDEQEAVGPTRVQRVGHPHRSRVRKNVLDIMDEMGPTHVRRACRMSQPTFFDLHEKLEPHLCPPRRNRKRKLKGAKNGLVSGETRLSAGIRYFAGGRPEDISVVHGISHSEVFNSVWKVVDGVNKCDFFNISHPSSHDEQRRIARGFEHKSSPSFR